MNGEINLFKDYCSIDLDLDIEFEIFLLCWWGLGFCVIVFVSYLICLYNEIVYVVEKFFKENNSYFVDVVEVIELYVISYEVEWDLILLIFFNC